MNLLETIISLSIIAITTVIGISFMGNVSGKRMEAASLKLFSMMQLSRSIAITEHRYAGIYIEKIDNKHHFTIVKDGNGNGLRTSDVEGGIDKKSKIKFCLEKDYVGVILEKNNFLGKKFISFNPFCKSSTGSLIFKTNNEQNGKIKIKLFGITTLMRPVRILPEGKEILM